MSRCRRASLAKLRRGADGIGDAEPQKTSDAVRGGIKDNFEITSEIILLECGTLAKEFEASIKAPRIVDKRAL